MSDDGGPETAETPVTVSDGYSNYVLIVLSVVYIFNFIDRQVLSILLIDIRPFVFERLSNETRCPYNFQKTSPPWQ